MLEIRDDGTAVAYLTRDFQPAKKEDAELIKVVHPGGRVEWVYPVRPAADIGVEGESHHGA